MDSPTISRSPASAVAPSGVRRSAVGWQPAVKRAGLAPLRPPDLRHTAVAFWIAAGAQPLEVARRAGHTSVVTVLDRYGHLLPRTDDPVTDAVDELAAAAKASPDRRFVRLVCDPRGRTVPKKGFDSGGRGGTRTPDICLVRAAL